MLSLSTYAHGRTSMGPMLAIALAKVPAAASKKTCTTTSRISFTSIGHSPCRSLTQAAGAGEADRRGGASIKSTIASKGQGLVVNPMPPEEIRGNELLSALDLRQERMPKHVAITLDGCRRWSQANNNGQLTYESFFSKFILYIDLCVRCGIPIATAFVFAACTLKRTDEANNLLFGQFQTSLEENLEKFMRHGIRVSFIGHKYKLPKSLQNTIKQVEEATKNGKSLDFRYAIIYGGREDIVDAARSISKKVKGGEIKPEDIDEAMVERHLSTRNFNIPNPELMIRYGGKRRFSNFYIWQAAYAELYFTDILGPDFEESSFIDALRCFQQCERRFGK